MVTNQPSGHGPYHGAFSAELTRDIAAALTDSLSARGPMHDATLHALAHRVCAEARELTLPPEKMLIAIKQLFEQLPAASVRLDERRMVFERFISSCIDDYFK